MTSRRLPTQFMIVSFCSLLTACGDPEAPLSDFVVSEHSVQGKAIVRPCSEYRTTKNAYFGDLHVHTALSNDGYSFGSRATPSDAYRYAFGQGSISLPVNQGDTELARSVSIDRPLDFVAVTDHAEFLGEQTLCQNPDVARTAEFCRAFEEGEGRNPSLLAKIFSPFPARDHELCGDDGERCKLASKIPWHEAIEAAEAWNDVSDACERTTFVAFEYSSVRLGSNLHRNVIFRNTRVTRRPISYLDAPREWRLWEILDKNCLDDTQGCDVLAIPHNSNISNGRMFAVDYAGASSDEAQVERVQLRRRIEPVVEIMQHKGDSECRNGLSGVLGGEDELCDFEKFEDLAFKAIAGTVNIDDCYAGSFADYVPHKGPNCLSRNSYVRYALIEGMKEQDRIGINPFQFGIMASTDTHNGTAGAVSEHQFAGHLGWGDGTPQRRVSYKSDVPGNTSNNPGGLIGVWSEQNSREDLFDSIRAKEVFGTSGPRIKPRFFAGTDYDSKICGSDAMIETAYANGVPMGGELSNMDKSPAFLVSALADSGTAEQAGTQLQRLQIIKGWYDEEGNHHQKVHDVAGNANNGAGVNLQDCSPIGEGSNQLCTVWRDPEFDAGQRAVYYMRAVENPSCRYSARQCLTIPADQRPEDCDNDEVAKTVQERAWSSPIWYSPAS
ncbi:MAG: DUF3604 domain-containing protein [Pseudomonadota bacterium]